MILLTDLALIFRVVIGTRLATHSEVPTGFRMVNVIIQHKINFKVLPVINSKMLL